ncbi:hypothetical protein DICSQDRAFT_139241 [Dichomitus squalens LYAD-421 SS1]|uniref:Uncharacterized protein n=1 Tax=Dichomitus squalens (strain LYAD-421) TaxID=732165 RepID=R7SUF4_DICSQ|nr:uncharacterized protein DICSQDRAFT_139241 [Dichomitus squalens LYAD-421 SS1]EJF58602.1 hypothetical protein DICSQDRAFT_139241 [Dichomitus squalens LYAD-421 SS1]
MGGPSESEFKEAESPPLLGPAQSSEESHIDESGLVPRQHAPDNDESRAEQESTIAGWLVWSFIFVAATLLSLAGLQFWPRIRPDGIRAEPQQQSLELERESWLCAEDVKLSMLPYSWQDNNPPTYRARASLKVPVASETLSFVSMDDGAGCDGTFRISQTAEPGTQAIVEVTASYSQPGAARDVHVCRLRRRRKDVEDTWRLGIQTPNPEDTAGGSADNRPSEPLHVDIHLRLPRSFAGSGLPLRINELHTDLPLYDHHLDTPSSVHFSKLNISTVLAQIHSESVSGDNITLQSVYGDISGMYNASSALLARSEEGLVNITALLQYDNSSAAAATTLNISTSTGPVFSEIALHSTTTNTTHSKFDVVANTGHASINLTFIASPVNSVLNVSAEIADPDGDWISDFGCHSWKPEYWDLEWDLDPVLPSRVTVQLHENFEGMVDLEMHAPTVFRPQIVFGIAGAPNAEEQGDGDDEEQGDSNDEEQGDGDDEEQGDDDDEKQDDDNHGEQGDGDDAAQRDGAHTAQRDGDDENEEQDPNPLTKIIVRAEEAAAAWHCLACERIRRIDAERSRPDGRATVGGVSWGKDKVAISDLEKRGKVVVRTVDSPITLLV